MRHLYRSLQLQLLLFVRTRLPMTQSTFSCSATKVSQTSKETLRSFLNKYCVEIDFIDIDGFMDAGCIDFDTQGWNEIVLSRLLLARFLGSDIQRVLYLDADTMVRGSLRSSGTLR